MYTSKRFADRSTARRHMIRAAKEIYNIELPETFFINEEHVSLNCRQVYFRSNTPYEVWKGTVIQDCITRYLICDISTGNITLLDKKDFN